MDFDRKTARDFDLVRKINKNTDSKSFYCRYFYVEFIIGETHIDYYMHFPKERIWVVYYKQKKKFAVGNPARGDRDGDRRVCKILAL